MLELGIGVIRQYEVGLVGYALNPILGDLPFFKNIQGVETEEKGLVAHAASVARVGQEGAALLVAEWPSVIWPSPRGGVMPARGE